MSKPKNHQAEKLYSKTIAGLIGVATIAASLYPPWYAQARPLIALSGLFTLLLAFLPLCPEKETNGE